jgi:hypothetical protein
MINTLLTATELDHRRNDGIDVWLLWRPEDGSVAVAVADAKTDDTFLVEVADASRALDVFHHPYAYRGEARASGPAPLSEVTS